jgi:hypothetical protein
MYNTGQVESWSFMKEQEVRNLIILRYPTDGEILLTVSEVCVNALESEQFEICILQ